MMVHDSIPLRSPKCRRRALLAAVLAILPGAAWAASCPGTGETPEVRVVTSLPEPDIRHALTRPQIGAMSGRGHMSSDRRHAGLTQTKTDFSIRPTLGFQRLPNGGLCASLKQVEVAWRMTAFQVDVAVEYRRGSCPYREVLAHENEHVDIARRAFTAADRALRQDIAEAARRIRPFTVQGTPQQAAQLVARQMMAAAQPALNRYRRDTDRENNAIDTAESYRAVQARCRDW